MGVWEGDWCSVGAGSLSGDLEVVARTACFIQEAWGVGWEEVGKMEEEEEG